MALDKSSFQPFALKIPISSSDKIDSIRVELVAENVSIDGAVYVTDVMLQGGTVATAHTTQASEMRWSFDNA